MLKENSRPRNENRIWNFKTGTPFYSNQNVNRVPFCLEGSESMNVFEAVRTSVTARQAAEYYGLKVSRKGMACCPFHPDKTPSMKLDTRYHCFGCGADGDAIDFVAQQYGLSKVDAAKKLASDFGLSYQDRNEAWKRPPVRASPVRPILSPAQEYQKAEDRCFRAYCDYLHLLQRWMIEQAPKSMDEEPNDLFVEACHKLTYVEYVLDEIFLSGTIEERAKFVREHGKEIPSLERRISEFTQGTAGCSASGCAGDGSPPDPQTEPEHSIDDGTL